MQDDALARIVIHEHPELGDGPVEIEVLADEAKVIEKAGLRVALVDIYLAGEEEPHRVAMDAAAFDQLATERTMAELLIQAPRARTTKRSSSRSASGSGAGGSASRGDRDYATLEHAGKPHRGKTTDEEKALVREHLDEINDRLAAEGLRTISLGDADHVERYGLEELAARRG
ncbi:MAG TPA: hypothetical protein VMG38_02985 [Trebonia sp.]|nr:hypothetical protein [Trebonia sp.]